MWDYQKHILFPWNKKQTALPQCAAWSCERRMESREQTDFARPLLANPAAGSSSVSSRRLQLSVQPVPVRSAHSDFFFPSLVFV